MAVQVPDIGLMLQLAQLARDDPQALARMAAQAGLEVPTEATAAAPQTGVGALVQPTGPSGVPGAPGGVSPNLGGQSAATPKPPIPPEAEQLTKQAALLKAIAALKTPGAQQLPPAAPAVSPAAGRQVQTPGLQQLLAALLPGGSVGQVGPSLGALIARQA